MNTQPNADQEREESWPPAPSTNPPTQTEPATFPGSPVANGLAVISGVSALLIGILLSVGYYHPKVKLDGNPGPDPQAIGHTMERVAMVGLAFAVCSLILTPWRSRTRLAMVAKVTSVLSLWLDAMWMWTCWGM